MIQGFYFHIYGLTNCKWISFLRAKVLYAVFFCRYMIKRLFSKKRIVVGDVGGARKLIDTIADNGMEPQYLNKNCDENIDLSIIIPVYNYKELIDANIQSVLNQKTKYNFQLIIVDDGSTDGAKDVLKKYEGINNVDIIYQENQGIAGARNTGLNNAKGKYIMFVDCDDILEVNCVETLMNRAYKDDCDIVMCAHNLVKEKEGRVYQVVPNIYPDYNLASYNGSAKILNYAGLPWGKVYKRELWENVRFFPGYWYEDSIIHSLIFTQCKKFAYEPQVCYQYKWYEKNFSHTQGNSANEKSIDRYRLIEKILKKCEELDVDKDECYETMLLKHLSSHYYPSISGLKDETVDALFVLACSLYEKYKSPNQYKLNFMLRTTKKALEQKDINLWKLASRYQK